MDWLAVYKKVPEVIVRVLINVPSYTGCVFSMVLAFVLNLRPKMVKLKVNVNR